MVTQRKAKTKDMMADVEARQVEQDDTVRVLLTFPVHGYSVMERRDRKLLICSVELSDANKLLVQLQEAM